MKLLFSAFLLIIVLINSTHSKSVKVDRNDDVIHKKGVHILGRAEKKVKVQTFFGSIKCWICKQTVNLLLRKSRTPDGEYPGLPGYIAEICIKSRIEKPNVCRGIVKAMTNETLYVLKHLQLTGSDICGLIFPQKCPSSSLPWNQNWIIDLPPSLPNPPNFPRTSEETLKVLQISDIHLDLKYSEGSEVDCDDPLCCRQKVSSPKRSAGFWGTRANCDIPFHTFDHLLKHLSNQTFDYIMWTGDLPAHDSWEQSRSKHVNLIKNLTDVLTHYFPKTRVYPSLGNHESYPVNSFPPHYINDSENNISWLYNKLAEAWRPWLDEAALQTVRLYGYYTLLHQPGFRIISLNMNYCNDMNYWTLVDAVDPDYQLRWLVQILSDAERKGEKVHILGHIPPAVVDSNCLTVWRNNYYRIIARFSHIITAQFFGHTHTDEIEVIYANKSRDHAIGVAYVSPSVTTYSNLDPAYRVYDVSQRDWTITNHYTFIMNLTEANQSEEPRWQLLYDAKSEYNLTNLQPVDWHKLLKRWNCEHPTSEDLLLFQKYYRNFYKGNPPQEFCDEDCRSKLLSKMAVSTRPRFS